MRKRKKKNKNIKVLTTLVLGIIAILGVYMFLKGKDYVKGATAITRDAFCINLTEEQLIEDYKNIYNVEYGQKLIKQQDIASAFETTALAQIRGEKVTFTNYANNTTSEGNKCVENNIMAAIANGIGVENTGYKYTKITENYYSGAQLAVWEFWNTWVENSDAEQYGFEKGIGNGTITDNELNGEVERKKAQEFATKNEYNVNIYFLKYLAENNESNIDNQPNYIYIEMIDEDGEIIELERPVEKDSDMYILVSKDGESLIKVGEEIIYNVNIYNQKEEQQENLLFVNKLPKGLTFTKAIKVIENKEIELKENVDYKYDKETRKLTINIDKIDEATKGTMANEETGETIEFTENGEVKYKILAKANKLKEKRYSQEISNVAEIQKEEKVLARNKTTNKISDSYIEIEIEELPTIINEKEECTIRLKIINKGLIMAENVSFKINIPEEILMQKYEIITKGENGESTNQGIATNKFERTSIKIPAETELDIKLKGIVNEVEKDETIMIEGTVNEEKIVWNTKIKNVSENEKVVLKGRRLSK